MDQRVLDVEEFCSRGQYAEAEGRALEVLAALSEDQSSLRARCENVLSECGWRTSQLPESALHADRALAYAEVADDLQQLGCALLNKATVFRERSLYAEALDLYHEAFHCFEKAEAESDKARAQMNIANVLRQLYQYDEAAGYLQQAFELFSRLGDQIGCGRTLNLIGLVCDEQSQTQAALQYYQQALERFSIGESTPAKDLSRAWLFKNIGSMHEALQQFDESSEYYQRAFQSFTATGNRFGAAVVQASLGVLCAETSWKYFDAFRAEELLLGAIAVLTELGDKHERAKCHRSLAKLYEAQQRWHESLVHFKHFYDLMQEVQSEAARKRAAAEAYERRIAEMRTEQEVAARYTDTIRKQLEIIQRDLRTAERIQHSILPDVDAEVASHRDRWDVAASMVAARSVGGDFYDVFPLDEHHLGLVIADVSGKGMPAALFMVVSRTMLKLLARADADPGEVLQQVNRMLCSENVLSMFVTVLYAVLDTRDGSLRYANAGHNPPLIRRKDGRLERADAEGGIILAIQDSAQYSSAEIKLEDGDTMFLYTDGVSEAMNPARELFGEDRIDEWFTSVDPNASLNDYMKHLHGLLEGFSAEAGQTDDITMVLVRRRA